MTNDDAFPNVPPLNGLARFVGSYGGKAILRNQIPTIEPGGRAANLFLRVTEISRKDCMAVGKYRIANEAGVRHIFRILRKRFAPDAIDAIFREVVKSTHF